MRTNLFVSYIFQSVRDNRDAHSDKVAWRYFEHL